MNTPSSTYATVNDAVPDLARRVLDGEESKSQNGELTLELLHQQITLTEPWDRYSRLPEREASLPFQIVRSMRILAGHDDTEWATRYLPGGVAPPGDGTTWSGGHGSRLRAFGPDRIDQLDAVIRELRLRPSSHRAVMSLHDPTIDTLRVNQETSGVVPPAGSITFQLRYGRLLAHVFRHSVDLVQDWSEADVFEWSLIQEAIASLLGVQVGCLTFSISSLHTGHQHWDRLQKIADAHPAQEAGRFLMEPAEESQLRLTWAPDARPLVEVLDRILEEWFERERWIREATHLGTAIHLLDQPSDIMPELFRKYLQVIVAARFNIPSLVGPPILRASLKTSPPVPFRLGADKRIPRTELTPAKSAVEPVPSLSTATTVPQLITAITMRHDRKHAELGDLWKRRGESLGILADIARKADQLDGGDNAPALDTAVDLLIYLVRYAVWLCDQETGLSYYENTWRANKWIAHAFELVEGESWDRTASEFAREIDAQLLSDDWKGYGTPAQKARFVDIFVRYAAQHVLDTWKASWA